FPFPGTAATGGTGFSGTTGLTFITSFGATTGGSGMYLDDEPGDDCLPMIPNPEKTESLAQRPHRYKAEFFRRKVTPASDGPYNPADDNARMANMLANMCRVLNPNSGTYDPLNPPDPTSPDLQPPALGNFVHNLSG